MFSPKSVALYPVLQYSIASYMTALYCTHACVILPVGLLDNCKTLLLTEDGLNCEPRLFSNTHTFLGIIPVLALRSADMHQRCMDAETTQHDTLNTGYLQPAAQQPPTPIRERHYDYYQKTRARNVVVVGTAADDTCAKLRQ